MSRFLALPLFVVSIFMMSCATSEEAVPVETSEPAAPSKYPAWYSSNGTASDSLSFHGYASAVASDSSRAISNAALTAKIRLESFIADEVEEVRQSLAENGATEASSTDYLLSLSNAVDVVEERAEVEQVMAQSEENYYRAFAQSSITKSEVRELLQNALQSEQGYWQVFSESSIFAERFN